MSKCIICREHEATVQDRNDYPSKRKKLCIDCHVNRLRHDLVDIMLIERTRNKVNRNNPIGPCEVNEDC